MADQYVFVTLGSTRFDGLVRAVEDPKLLQTLVDCGFSRLIVQYGKGDPPCCENVPPSLSIETFDYQPSIIEYIQGAALVLSHGGSGTLIECLRENAATIAVINDTLMGNHQVEFAEAMAHKRYLCYTTPCALLECVRAEKWRTLEPFPPPPARSPFLDLLDSHIGIIQ
eukprot:TRINITY_DN5521_c0_g1_i2.p2 TRINITY_DN5521_c0_g1~~TRINITY_DN5521_c0_g1_i2.p2  ORF type:complete len:169 (-),score=56.03 TRINITY_DN5521_c0_g1_i2:351-857(-)